LQVLEKIMVSLLKVISLALFGLALTACAGTRSVQLPPADEFLIPQISADGSKFFEFQRQYIYPDPDPTDRLLGRESQSGSRQFTGDPRLVDAEIERRLNRAFELTGYCRNGYFQLYRDQSREGFTLRGECREDADEEDRRRFSAGAPIPILGDQSRL
jgi:hypothetical protein